MRWCVLVPVLALVSGDSKRVHHGNGRNVWKAHKPAISLTTAEGLLQQQRGSRDANQAYGAPPPPAEGDVIDLHNKEFCVDVSTYQPVVWVEREAEECETVFVKQCSDKSENVCQDVTETKCEVSLGWLVFCVIFFVQPLGSFTLAPESISTSLFARTAEA